VKVVIDTVDNEGLQNHRMLCEPKEVLSLGEKHAYLIIANNKFNQLAYLLELLDDARNDIFLMIDGKSDLQPDKIKLLRNSVIKAHLYFSDRINIYWGGYSQIKAEMCLFQLARKTGHYVYYHLISGVDLPLHSQEYIHNFFDHHPDKIFLTMTSNLAFKRSKIMNRVIYNYYFIKYSAHSLPNFKYGKLFRLLEKTSLGIQMITGLGAMRRKKLPVIYYASNWLSLDESSVDFLLSNESKIKKIFRHAFLCDELFVPTVLFSDPRIKDKLYWDEPDHNIPNELLGNLRYINWWDGSPYVWQDKDISALKEAASMGHLFARKFDLEQAPKLKSAIKKMCS